MGRHATFALIVSVIVFSYGAFAFFQYPATANYFTRVGISRQKTEQDKQKSTHTLLEIVRYVAACD